MKFREREQPSDTITREQRIAGLIKLWAIVNTFDPHVKHASPAWKTVLRDGIPAVEAAQTAHDYYREIRRLVSSLNDSHVEVRHRSNPYALGTLPIEMRPAGGRVLVTAVDPALRDDVRAGDEVVAVDGKSVREFEQAWRTSASLSTPDVLQRDIWILQIPFAAAYSDAKLKFTLERDGKRHDVELPRTASKSFPPTRTPAFRRVDGGLGYLDLNAIASGADLETALKELSGTRGLILDIRNGLSSAGYGITQYLIDAPVRSPQWIIPVVNTADEDSRTWRTEYWWVQPHKTLHYRNPVAVLIDANAQSFMETFCMVLRNAKRVTFVGSPTTGTNGNVTVIELPGGGRMSFTGMRAEFDDGTPFQNVGVRPDVEVRPTFHGLRAGKDEVLNKAVEVLNGRS